MWEFLQTAEGIAVASATVASLSVIVTGFSIWLNYRGSGKRLEHEARLQEQRLAHERREAVQATAARAYRLAIEAQRQISMETSAVQNTGGEGMPPVGTESYKAASDALELVTAVGWSEEVRQCAHRVLVSMLSFRVATWFEMQRLERENQIHVPGEHLSAWGAMTEALERFRKAIAE